MKAKVYSSELKVKILEFVSMPDIECRLEQDVNKWLSENEVRTVFNIEFKQNVLSENVMIRTAFIFYGV
jgi:hypothetical protein